MARAMAFPSARDAASVFLPKDFATDHCCLSDPGRMRVVSLRGLAPAVIDNNARGYALARIHDSRESPYGGAWVIPR